MLIYFIFILHCFDILAGWKVGRPIKVPPQMLIYFCFILEYFDIIGGWVSEWMSEWVEFYVSLHT